MVSEVEQLTPCLTGRISSSSSPLPAWKRGLDLACLIVSLPLTVPVGLFIAVFIKLCSKGPIVFKQERVGFGGQRFTCYKFRSMRVNAEISSHQNHLKQLIRSDKPMTKLDSTGDVRLIPGGVILRATGLDELPQLINVWLGDMSLVGPRPCLPYEYAEYSGWEKQRCNAAPGLTGLWQVSGKNKTTFREMIQLDIRYSQTKSLWLDVKIMFLTFSALLTQVRETMEANAGTLIFRGRNAGRETPQPV